ncbi:MAG TPA: glycosyltransferase 61 family protein [Albidovulum sp.]|uniref:glycosyltransferase 61 family protein n=1 Tax=Albidovulum sp. TaxID=1872424 RepID=UPI002B7BEB6A|nr:glycosyltransferase 61 family protein [Albidovulum sp.]
MPGRAPAVGLTVPYENAMVVPPPARPFQGRVLPVAVLDREGEPVAAAACATHRFQSASYQPDAASFAKAGRLGGSWLWGGLYSHHFGHQITRSLGRLAGLEGLDRPDGILFVRLDRRAAKRGTAALFLRLLDGLGINCPVRILTAPTEVERLHIGADLFGEQTDCTAAPAYVDWARRQFLPDAPRPVPGSRLYVTRSRLDPSLGRILCEDALEANLARHGYDIFAPETHSVPDQIRRYAAAETIVTTDGSHGHLIAFARRPGQRVLMVARRQEAPAYLVNHLQSFGTGLAGAEFRYLNVLQTEWWPKERADNRSLGEIDFAALHRELANCGAISSDASIPWTVPGEAELEHSRARGLKTGEQLIPADERPAFLAELRTRRAMTADPVTKAPDLDPVPAIDGLRYFRMLSRLHGLLKPEWYLEIGTFTGKSLALAQGNYVAVDPEFRIEHPIVNGRAREMLLVQKTSDDFFASDFLRRNRIAFNLAFLDGLHLFEALLRDFISTEKAMDPGGVILLHDCCPTTRRMAERDRPKGLWTGDVWKTLLILLRHRPDLKIEVTNAAPTGLVVISNLNPKSRTLERCYAKVLAEFSPLSLDDLPGGVGGLYRHFDLKAPEAVLAALATTGKAILAAD